MSFEPGAARPAAFSSGLAPQCACLLHRWAAARYAGSGRQEREEDEGGGEQRARHEQHSPTANRQV